MSGRDGVDVAARYGPWALIAGGSEGIGLAFAHALAARGVKLILVALDEPSLEQARAALPTEVVTVAVDLTEPDALDAVAAAVGDREVGLLVANAALSPLGAFLDVDVDAHVAAVRLNAETAVRLVHRWAPPMQARARGGIVLLSSLSSLQGTAVFSSYAATKAFLRVLAEGLWYELRPHGVDVVAVLPGTTDTPGLRASQPRGGPKPMDPQQVADEVVSRLRRGPVVIPGRANRIVGFITTRLLPRRAAIGLISGTTQRMYRRP